MIVQLIKYMDALKVFGKFLFFGDCAHQQGAKGVSMEWQLLNLLRMPILAYLGPCRSSCLHQLGIRFWPSFYSTGLYPTRPISNPFSGNQLEQFQYLVVLLIRPVLPQRKAQLKAMFEAQLSR